MKLFDRTVKVEDNCWLWHLHLKTTNICNGKCSFCIEQNSKCKEDPDLYLENVDRMLSEMSKAGILYSVSLTGGEPLLFSKFNELCDILKKYNIKFLTMNTNGRFLYKYVDIIDGLFDFVNISRHSVDDIKK